MTAPLLVFYIVISNVGLAPRQQGERFIESMVVAQLQTSASISPLDSTYTLPVTEVTAERQRSAPTNTYEYDYYRTEYQYLARVLVKHAFYLLVIAITTIIGAIVLNKIFSYIHHSRIRRETLTIPLRHLAQRRPGDLLLWKRGDHFGSKHKKHTFSH